MSADYARPTTVEDAVELLAAPGALPMLGGTDLAGQIDRGIVAPELLVDMRAAGLDRLDGRGRRRADRRRRHARHARRLGAARALRRGRRARRRWQPRRRCATSARSAATSARARAAGTTAARSGTAGSAAATPATPSSAITASTTSSRATASPPIRRTSRRRSPPAGRASSCARRPGERELDLLDLYRIPTEENRSLLTLAHGEIVSEVRLPAPPQASAYQRLGERQAFSFPLVAVAAARRDGALRVVAGGVANIPVAIDPADPLAELPGNPQTMWKRTALATLTERAVAALGAG